MRLALLLILAACGDSAAPLIEGAPIVALAEGERRELIVGEALRDAELSGDLDAFAIAAVEGSAPPRLVLEPRCDAVVGAATGRRVTLQLGDAAPLLVVIAQRRDGACAPRVRVTIDATCDGAGGTTRPVRYPTDASAQTWCVAVDPFDPGIDHALEISTSLPASTAPTPVATTTGVAPALEVPLVANPALRGRFIATVRLTRTSDGAVIVDDEVPIEAGAVGDVGLEVGATAAPVDELGVVATPVRLWSFAEEGASPCLRIDAGPGTVGSKDPARVRCATDATGGGDAAARACADGQFVVEVSPRPDASRALSVELSGDLAACAGAARATATLPLATRNVVDDVTLDAGVNQLACWQAPALGHLLVATGPATAQAFLDDGGDGPRTVLAPSQAGTPPRSVLPIAVDGAAAPRILADVGGTLFEATVTAAGADVAWNLTAASGFPGGAWQLARAATVRAPGGGGARWLVAPRGGQLVAVCVSAACAAEGSPIDLGAVASDASIVAGRVVTGVDADAVIVVETDGDVAVHRFGAPFGAPSRLDLPGLLAPGTYRGAPALHLAPSASRSLDLVVLVPVGGATGRLLSTCDGVGCQLGTLQLLGPAAGAVPTDALVAIGTSTGVHTLEALGDGAGGGWVVRDPLLREQPNDAVPLLDEDYGLGLTACVGAPARLAFIVERNDGTPVVRVTAREAEVAGPWR